MSHPRSSWADASDSDSSPANSPTLRPKPSNTSNVDDSFFDAPNLRVENTTNNGSNHSNGNNRRNNRDNNNNRDNDRNHSRDNNHSNNRNTGDPARDNNCDNNRNNGFPTRREERPKETRNFDDNWRRSAPSMPSAARDNRDGRDSEVRYKGENETATTTTTTLFALTRCPASLARFARGQIAHLVRTLVLKTLVPPTAIAIVGPVSPSRCLTLRRLPFRRFLETWDRWGRSRELVRRS